MKEIHDGNIRRMVIHNQDVFIPTATEWREILKLRLLEGTQGMSDLIVDWLEQYSHFDVAHLGVVRWLGRSWMPLPLLELTGRFYRVHYEDVICEHCNQKCGPSATPEFSAYGGTGYSHAQVVSEFSELPTQLCPHCHNELRRRWTLWLAANQSRDNAKNQ